MRFPGICAIALFLGSIGFAQQQSEIAGDYVEVRSNRVFGCYCEWSGEAVTSGKEAVMAWNIKAGSFHGIPLRGVKIVAVVVAETTLSQGRAPRRSVLFIDDSAARESRQAAQAVFRDTYSHMLGEILRVHEVPIHFRSEPDEVDVSAGEIVNVWMRKARPPEDAMKGAIHWYDPFIPLAQVTLGTAMQNRYRGQDFDRQWDVTEQAITGYYGQFSFPPRQGRAQN